MLKGGMENSDILDISTIEMPTNTECYTSRSSIYLSKWEVAISMQ